MKRRERHQHPKDKSQRSHAEHRPPPVVSRPESGPLFVLDRTAVREIDRLAVLEFGIPSILLMENAARHVADVALEWVEEIDRPRVIIVCGHGHNGGDGLAVARHLSNAGLDVSVVLTSDESRFDGDAGVNLGIIKRMGLAVHVLDRNDAEGSLTRIAEVRGGVHLVVDAVLGTGLDRPVTGLLAGVVAAMNGMRAKGATVLAVDIPSGVDADTGEPLGAWVQADVTVTFVGLKPGFLTGVGRDSVGEVVVADIGAPRGLVERLGRRLPMLSAARRLSEHLIRLRPPPAPKKRRRRPPS